MNYTVLPDLGNLNQVFFDKTDTLTQGTMRVGEIATYQKCYQIPSRNIENMLVECMGNPDTFGYEDEADKRVESEDYSEKSQEYEQEIEGQFIREVNEEDSSSQLLFDPSIYPNYERLHHQRSLKNITSRPSSPDPNMMGFQEIIMKLDSNNSVAGRESNSNKDKDLIPKEFLHLKALEKKFVHEMKINGPEKTSRKYFLDKGKYGTDSVNGTSDSEDMADFTNERRIEFKVDKKLTDRNFIFDVQSKKDHLLDVLNLLMVCAECGASDIKTVRSMSLEDRAILDLLFKLSYQIQCLTERGEQGQENQKALSIDAFTSYQVTARSQARGLYDVVCVNAYSMNRGRMSVILREETSEEDEYLLVAKGEDHCFRDCFNTQSMGRKEQIHYKALLTDYRVHGLKRIILATKKLSKKEVVEYLEIYNMISESSREQLDTFELHADKIEKKMTFLGCIGLKDIVRDDAHKLVTSLKTAKIQVNILSGDSIDNCLNAAKELSLAYTDFNNSSSYFSLNFRSEKQGMMDMRRILDTIYELLMDKNLAQIEELLERVQKEKEQKRKKNGDQNNSGPAEESAEMSFRLKRPLVISGYSVLIISGSQLMKDYLKTIFLFSNCVIGYSMIPVQKAIIVKLFKEMGQTVMAVGDGFNDLCMFNQADVSVQIQNKDVPMILADILVEDLNVLRYFVLCEGASMNSKITTMQFIVISVNIIWNTIQCLYMATTLFSSPLITAFETMSTYCIVCLSCVAYMTVDYRYNYRFLLTYPSIYLERNIVHTQLTKIIVAIFGVSLFEGLVLYLVVANVLVDTHEMDGKVVTKSVLAAWVNYVLVFTSILKVFYVVAHTTKVTLLVFGSIALFTSAELLIDFSNIGRTFLDDISFRQVFENTVYVFAFVCIGGGITYIDWLMIQLLKNKYLFPIGRILQDSVKRKNYDFFRLPNANKNIKSEVRKISPNSFKSDIIGAIKNCYNHETINDAHVQRIMSIDYFNFSLPIDNFNQIKDISERRKFTRVRQSNEILYIRFYLILTIGLSVVDIIRHILLNDYRKMYYFDSVGSYILLIYSFALAITFGELRIRWISRLLNISNISFVVLNIIFSSFRYRLFHYSTYFHASRLIMSPIGSNFILSSILAVINDLLLAFS